MDKPIVKKQVKSRERVQQHGEVFTADREVKAMVDLVQGETERLDSRFLEPACGDGNFLAEILRRKLSIPYQRAKEKKITQLEYEKSAIVIVSCLYGIEIQADNVQICQQRLLDIFCEQYRELFNEKTKSECIESVRYLLTKNIIHGDALSYHRVDKPEEWIIVSEWSLVGEGMMNRRDYEFSYLVGDSADDDLFSDVPCDTYKPIHFLNLNSDSYGE